MEKKNNKKAYSASPILFFLRLVMVNQLVFTKLDVLFWIWGISLRNVGVVGIHYLFFPMKHFIMKNSSLLFLVLYFPPTLSLFLLLF